MGQTAQKPARTSAGDSVDTLYQTTRTRVTRRCDPDGARILKQPLGPGAVERLRHERAMLARLTGVPGVLEPLEDPATPQALVFADSGGTALSALLAARGSNPVK